MYRLNLLAIALELTSEDPAWKTLPAVYAAFASTATRSGYPASLALIENFTRAVFNTAVR
jgi:hypothetical protein